MNLWWGMKGASNWFVSKLNTCHLLNCVDCANTEVNSSRILINRKRLNNVIKYCY